MAIQVARIFATVIVVLQLLNMESVTMAITSQLDSADIYSVILAQEIQVSLGEKTLTFGRY
jgi:hypothetical protein